MKRIYILAGLVFLGVCGYAQQLPLYTQYTALPYLYNPAFAGATEDVRVGLLHRAQWKGIPGAPTTSVLTADGPIQEKNIGLAATLFQDVTDITQRLGFYTSYSYKLKVAEDQNVLFGLSLGFAQQRIDFSKSLIKDDNDPMLMYRQNLRKTYFDATLGVGYTWKDLEIGLSAPQLIGNKLEYVNTNSSSYYYMARHMVFSAKYDIHVNKEQEMKVYPLVLLRYAKGAPVQYDINAVFDWKKYGWLAVTYKSNYAVGVNLGVRLNNTLRAGYAYDFTINTIKNYAGGAHEFFLGYTFGGRDRDVIEDIKPENPVSNTGGDSMIDVLITKNEKQQQEINRLNDEVEKLKSKNDSVKNTASTKPGVQVANVNDFQTSSGGAVNKGLYVVIGAFKSSANAENARKSIASKFPDAATIFNKERGFHYVYILKSDRAEEAGETLLKIQDQYKDAWIFDMK